jgi:hypothetical protein
MTIIANLITRVGCDVSGLLEGFTKSKNATRNYVQDVASIAGGNLIAAGIEKGVEIIKEIGHAVIEAAEEMKQLQIHAANMGVTTSSFQQLQYAAKEAGMEIQDVEKFMRKLAVNVVEKPKVFEQLGLDAQKISGMGLDQQFAVVRDRLMEIQNINDRMDLANKLFGKGGGAALKIDQQEAAKSMAEMGGGVPPEAVAKLAEFAKEWEKLWMGIKNMGIKFCAIFADVGILLVKALQEIVAWINQLCNALIRLRDNPLANWLFGQWQPPAPPVNEESRNAAQKLAEDIETLTQKLEKEIATSGMSAEQSEIWALKKRGATDAQVAHIEALEKEHAAIKKGIEEEKRMTDEIRKNAEEREKATAKKAEQITQDNYSPEQKFRETMGELNAMIEEGRISWETYARAKNKAVSGIPSDIGVSSSANWAVEYGSQKMYDLLAKMMADQQNKDYQQKLLAQTQLSAERLKQIAENTSQAPQVASVL